MTSRSDLRLVVIGAGMPGILAAIRLRDSGFRQIAVLEKGDRVGRSWCENKSRPTQGIVTLQHKAFNQQGKLVAQCKRFALVLNKPRP